MDLRTHKNRNLGLDSDQFVVLNDRLAPMNNYCSIEDATDRLLRDFDWSHAFIRECYLTTLHSLVEYVDSDGKPVVGDADGPLNARLAIAFAGNAEETGVEFVFHSVNVFAIQKLEELTYEYEYSQRSGHLIRFSNHDNGQCYIQALTVLVRFLGRGYLGAKQLVGFELPTDKWHIATKADGCWRQCGNCKNIWEESPSIEFSRCPDCGEVTRLM
jgi:hypothetical protein